MARVKGGFVRRRRVKKILKQAKGYRGRRSRIYSTAKQAVMKSLQYAYRDRRDRKRQMRRLWQLRINAAVREHGLSYSRFMHLLKQKNIQINRKMLADIAVNDAKTFAHIIDYVK